MATSIIDSLFGPTPYDTEQARRGQDMSYAEKVARMNGFEQAKFGIGQGAAGLTRAGAGMMGMVDPSVEEARMREAVMGMGGDLTTSAGLKAKAMQFAQAGDQRTAMKLAIAAKQMEAQEEEAKLKQAHAKYYEQGGARGPQSQNSQLAAKQAIARNDALKFALNAGYKGQDLLDFVDRQVQMVTDTWNKTIGVQQPEQGEVPLSTSTSVSNNLEITQEQKEAMIQDASSRGDVEAVAKIQGLPVTKPVALPKSKAEVAGEVKLAETKAANDPKALAAGAAAKEAGKGASESNEKLYQQAESAAAILPKLDRLENEIVSSTFKPGAFADFRVAIEKAQSLLGGKDAAKTASDAEILNALMGQEVFSLLGAMGLGSKQMDTPAERDFMRQVLAGTITMERGALKRLVQIRKADAQETLNRYNKKVESGELDEFLNLTNRQKKKFETKKLTIEERLSKYPGVK